MGGGGGGYSIGPDDFKDLEEEIERRTERSLADSEINTLLGEELARLNERDVELISRLLDAITEALGEEIEVDRLLFGGSVAKRTYVDGLSDVDSLVVLDDEGANSSPAELRERLASTLRAKLPQGEVDEIRTGDLAVSVRYRDGTEIQLLPARERGDAVQISSADGSGWQQIDPRPFAQALSAANREQKGALVPTIKLAKKVVSHFAEDQQLSGYHTEALALSAFQGYNGPRTPKEMLTHFFEAAAAGVMRPIADITGQSPHIDEDLGSSDSPARTARARALRETARQMANSRSADDWRNMLDP